MTNFCKDYMDKSITITEFLFDNKDNWEVFLRKLSHFKSIIILHIIECVVCKLGEEGDSCNGRESLQHESCHEEIV